MANFRLYDSAGQGFWMSTTGDSGFAFVVADPSVSETLTFDDGSHAEFAVDGSPIIDGYAVDYFTPNGYNFLIDNLYAFNFGAPVLTVTDLDLYTDVDAMTSGAAWVRLNAESDTWHGNNFNDLIRAGMGNDSVYGNGGDDILYGEKGNDTLRGGSGIDALRGGAGNDKLYGGAGEDGFFFDSKASSTNRDRIGDFNKYEDTIILSNGAFSRVGGDGWLKKGAFYATTSGKAHDSNDRIIYDKDSGALLYDADGTGSALAVQFATAGKNLGITYKDFYII